MLYPLSEIPPSLISTFCVHFSNLLPTGPPPLPPYTRTHFISTCFSPVWVAREGLTGAQVIVKGLGSGFHQPVTGVHQLSQVSRCHQSQVVRGQGSPLTGVHQLSQVSGCHQSQVVKGQCSPLTGVHQVSQVSGCHQSQVVKGQGSPLTSVHELSHASVTITGYQRAGFTTHRCSPAVTGESH